MKKLACVLGSLLVLAVAYLQWLSLSAGLHPVPMRIVARPYDPNLRTPLWLVLWMWTSPTEIRIAMLFVGFSLIYFGLRSSRVSAGRPV